MAGGGGDELLSPPNRRPSKYPCVEEQEKKDPRVYMDRHARLYCIAHGQ